MRSVVAFALAGLLLAGCSSPPAGPNPVVLMKTSMGDVTIELFQAKAPITVKNFLDYVEDEHYDGTIFHRVIPTFMIQGGGFTPGMKREKPTRDPIRNESTNGLGNDQWTISMARTDDPHSATSQFFINVKDNPGLNRAGSKDGYAVFGRVIAGFDAVGKIRDVETGTVATDSGPHENVPVEDVVILSIRRVEKTEKK